MKSVMEDHPEGMELKNVQSTAEHAERTALKKDIPSVDEYAERIERGFKKGCDGEREMADACAEAQENLDAKQLKRLHDKMCVDKGEFSKWNKVGCSQKLKDPSIWALLPSGVERKYAVALFTDKKIDDAIAAGVLNPKATRGELNAFRKGKPPESPTRKLAEIRVPRKYDPAKEANLIAALRKILGDRPGCELVLAKPKAKVSVGKKGKATAEESTSDQH